MFSLGGIGAGFTKGLEYEAAFNKLLLQAFEHGDTALQHQLAGVAKQWLADATDAAGNIKGELLLAVLGGADPFAADRHMLQAIMQAHGMKLP